MDEFSELLERYRLRAEAALTTMNRRIREAADDKVSMPANYWHDTYRAQMKHDLAVKLVEALKEDGSI